jgi:ABC-type sugar transport system permease subunit
VYSQVKPRFFEKGRRWPNFNQTMCFGEQGRSRIPFGAGLSRELKILVTDESFWPAIINTIILIGAVLVITVVFAGRRRC